MAIKITFINGTVRGIDFAEAVKEELEKTGIEMVNNGYNVSEDATAYIFVKDNERIGRLDINSKLNKNEVKELIKSIKSIKEHHTPHIEEVEYDL